MRVKSEKDGSPKINIIVKMATERLRQWKEKAQEVKQKAN